VNRRRVLAGTAAGSMAAYTLNFATERRGHREVTDDFVVL
jgi:hypothetical protein